MASLIAQEVGRQGEEPPQRKVDVQEEKDISSLRGGKEGIMHIICRSSHTLSISCHDQITLRPTQFPVGLVSLIPTEENSYNQHELLMELLLMFGCMPRRKQRDSVVSMSSMLKEMMVMILENGVMR